MEKYLLKTTMKQRAVLKLEEIALKHVLKMSLVSWSCEDKNKYRMKL